MYKLDDYFKQIKDPNGNLIYDLTSFNFINFPYWIGSSLAEEFLVRDKTANTPDLISYMVYGTTSLWWIICLANRISDPFEELPSGKRIMIPSLSKVNEFISNKGTSGTIVNGNEAVETVELN